MPLLKLFADGTNVGIERINKSTVISRFNEELVKQILYCIVLYCIMRPYTDGRVDRNCICIPRELFEIRGQPWLSEGSLPAIYVTTKNPSFNCALTQFYQQCLCYHIMNDILDCYL